LNTKNLEYFIAIVENDFNITKAAQALYISQPALSKAINKLEKENSIVIFKRARGRLQGLTPAGTSLYVKGKELLEDYNSMIDIVMSEAKEIKGDIDIGISPVIISYLFPRALPKFIRENPKINLNIAEEGAVSLKEKLINDQVSITTLLSPTGLNVNEFEQIKLAESKLAIFLDKNNVLAQRDLIKWKDLNEKSIALFSDTYMINQQITNVLAEKEVNARIQLKSDSWDLLLNSTFKSNLVTILPKPIANFHNMEDIVMIDFEEDIKWNIYLCRRKKEIYSNVEEYTFNFFIEYFKNNDI